MVFRELSFTQPMIHLHPSMTGYLSSRPQPLNSLSTVLVNAIRLFTNLSSIKLTPATYHDDVFIQPLTALTEVENLHDLTVNLSCMGEVTAPLLATIKGIQRLTLHGPGRSILNILPEWLGRLSRTLTGLHLKVNSHFLGSNPCLPCSTG